MKRSRHFCSALLDLWIWRTENNGCDWLFLWKPTFPCLHDVVHPQLPILLPRQMHIRQLMCNNWYIYPNSSHKIWTWMSWTLVGKIHFKKGGNIFLHSQQLVTAKLFATSRLSMWGVNLNSEVPNWTIPIRNALYSWSAPLGKSPPETDTKFQLHLNNFSIMRHIFYPNLTFYARIRRFWASHFF